jgi:hypothetical protein
LKRENTEVLHASLVKDTMRRKRPSFSESSYGYDSFGDMLEEAAEAGFITLREDERSGTKVITGLKTGRRRKRSSGGKKAASKKKTSRARPK